MVPEDTARAVAGTSWDPPTLPRPSRECYPSHPVRAFQEPSLDLTKQFADSGSSLAGLCMAGVIPFRLSPAQRMQCDDGGKHLGNAGL